MHQADGRLRHGRHAGQLPGARWCVLARGCMHACLCRDPILSIPPTNTSLPPTQHNTTQGPLGIAAAVGKPLSAFRHQPPVPALLSLLLPRLAALPLIGPRLPLDNGGKGPTPAPLPSTTTLGKAELVALARAYVEGGMPADEGMLAPDFMCVFGGGRCVGVIVGVGGGVGGGGGNSHTHTHSPFIFIHRTQPIHPFNSIQPHR